MKSFGAGHPCARGVIRFGYKLRFPSTGELTIFQDGLDGVGHDDVVVVNADATMPHWVGLRAYVSGPGSVAIVISGRPDELVDLNLRFLVLPWG